MAKMKFNRSFSVTRVVSRLVYTILALYVGGIIMTVFGDVMNQTASGFYDGLTLIGWTLDDNGVICGYVLIYEKIDVSKLKVIKE